MGKVVIIFVLVVAAIFATVVTNVQHRSEALPEALGKNFKDIGSYALQYGVNQISNGDVTETTTQEFNGDNEFRVLNGMINSIQYNFTMHEGYDIEIGGGNDGGNDNSNGRIDINGNLHINPNNSSSNRFEMETPNGTIDRNTLHYYGASFSYTGPASSVKIKPKSNGRTLNINGVDIVLNTNTRYTITSDNMNVNLRNSNPNENNKNKAMGRWWIQIDATNVELDPVPNGDWPDYQDDDGEGEHYVIDPFVQEVQIIADISMFHNGNQYDHSSEALIQAGGGQVDFDIDEDGGVIVHEDVSCEIKCLGEAFADAVVQMSYSIDGGENFSSLYDGNNIQGGETFTIEELAAESEVALRADWQRNYYYPYSGYEISNSGSRWVDVYRDGDQAPNYVPYTGQQGAEEFMSPYLNENGVVTLAENDAIFLFELGKGTWDYQDAVMLITFTKETTVVDNGLLEELENLDTSLQLVYWHP